MKRLIAILILSLPCVSVATSAPPEANTGQRTAPEMRGVVLYDFGATRCEPCQRMKPVIEQIKKRGYTVREIDIDQQPYLAAQFGITKIPAFVVLDGPREVARHVGTTNEAGLLALLAKAKSPKVIKRTAQYQTIDTGGAMTAVPPQPTFSAPSLPGQIREAIVQVIAFDPFRQSDGGQGMSVASGTIVGSTNEAAVVLTCWHLLSEGGKKFVVRLPDGRQLPATFLGSDQALDLAAVEIASPGIEPVEIETEPPKQGEFLYFAGYGGNRTLAAFNSRMIGFDSINGQANAFLEVAGLNRSGDSGGPIFNTSYRLVGVQLGHGQRSVNGCHCGHVRNFLARLGWRLRHPFQPPRANPYNPRGDLAKARARQAQQTAPIQPRQQAPLQNPSPPAPGREPLGHAINPGQATPNDGDLPGPVDDGDTSRPTLPTVEPGTLSPVPPRPGAGGEESLRDRIQDRAEAVKESVRDKALDVATGPVGQAAEGWLSTKALALAAGFGVPGWLAAGGLWIAKRRIKKRLQEKLAARQRTSATNTIFESDPLPQDPIVIERNRNHFVEVDRAKTDAAWSRASEIIADYYPGAAYHVSAVERLKNQILKGEPLEFPPRR